MDTSEAQDEQLLDGFQNLNDEITKLKILVKDCKSMEEKLATAAVNQSLIKLMLEKNRIKLEKEIET